METKNLNQRVSRVLVVAALMCVSLAASASSWNWSDCVSWFRGHGKEYLALYAHPTYNVDEYVICETSPDIIIKVYYIGHFVDYSCKYKITKGYKDGMYFFKDVQVLSEGNFWVNSFEAWDMVPKLYSPIYNNFDFKYLFGASKFNNMYSHQKAAAALTMEFMARYL